MVLDLLREYIGIPGMRQIAANGNEHPPAVLFSMMTRGFYGVKLTKIHLWRGLNHG